MADEWASRLKVMHCVEVGLPRFLVATSCGCADGAWIKSAVRGVLKELLATRVQSAASAADLIAKAKR